MTILNRAKGAAPLYSQLENILKKKIEDGEYKKGDAFLSEKQLQEEYSVSRVTVRQAMSNLVNSGYISSARGIGTVVVFDKINEKLKQVVSFSQEMKLHGIEMSTSYCKITRDVVPVFVSKETELAEKSECFKLVRVRCDEKRPIVYSVTYLNPKLNLKIDDNLYKDSLYEFLKDNCGVWAVNGTDTFEAVAADEVTAQFLQIKSGVPVFKRTRKTYDQNGNIIEYTVCYYPGDRYKYTAEL